MRKEPYPILEEEQHDIAIILGSKEAAYYIRAKDGTWRWRWAIPNPSFYNATANWNRPARYNVGKMIRGEMTQWEN